MNKHSALKKLLRVIYVLPFISQVNPVSAQALWAPLSDEMLYNIERINRYIPKQEQGNMPNDSIKFRRVLQEKYKE